MICYRDRTFCVSEGCTNECGRQLTKEDREKAEKVGLPIAQSEFCKNFRSSLTGAFS